MSFVQEIEGDLIEVGGAFTDANGDQHSANWQECWSQEEIAAKGLEEYADPGAPSGVRVTGTSFARVVGVPTKIYATAPFSVEELRAMVEAKRDQVLAAGFTPATGPLAGETLQTRELSSRIDWLVSQASYGAAVQQGFGDVLGAEFRVLSNVTIPATFAEGYATLLAMASWGRDVMARSWALKDAIAAGDPVTVEDIATGWPA